MNNKILAILLLVFVVGLTVLSDDKSKQQIPLDADVEQTQKSEVPDTVSKKLETKTDDQASVTVIVTPVDISPETGKWRFDVILDTHSVELDQDMTTISVLIDDLGNEYKPIRWEGAEAGGHHREGVLIFNQITPIPKFVELKISSVGGVARSFTWQL